MVQSGPSSLQSGNLRSGTRAHPKFYAVRIGTRPGVYSQWGECLEQVKGYKGAIFKSFPTLREAEMFITGPASHVSVSSRPSKFYAVREGKVPGIYTDWPSAQLQIIGCKRPTYRSFTSWAEAQAFLETDFTGFGREKQDFQVVEDEVDLTRLPTKRRKVHANNQPRQSKGPPERGQGLQGNTAVFPKGTLHSQGISTSSNAGPPNENAVGLPGMGPSNENGSLRVFTDGSTLNNGHPSAIAGIGVYFGPDDLRNVSEPLPGSPQTNQRAELSAVSIAIDKANGSQVLTIVTDSRYTVNCVTIWHQKWCLNGWKTAGGKPVENRDLIETILRKVDLRQRDGKPTTFEWIKAHASLAGNVEADRLAVAAARKAQTLTDSFQQVRKA